VRTRRRRGGPPRGGRGRGPESVEQPRTDEEGVSAEGREQPEVEPEVETAPAAVVDAPEATDEPKTVEKPGESPKGPAD
jgi:hypothetical protein